MKKQFFLRGSENIEEEIKRGYSFHVIPAETAEEAAEFAEINDLDIENVVKEEGWATYSYKLNGLCGIGIEENELEDIENSFAFAECKRYSENVYLCCGVYCEDDEEIMPDGQTFFFCELIKKV